MMNEFLAQAYGTGQSPAQQVQQEAEKTAAIAEAQLFCKLAADEGIDLNSLPDAQVQEMWQTYKAAAEEEAKKEEAKKGPPEAKKDEEEKKEEEKKAAAEAEFSKVKEAQTKLAEADFIGRVIAHAYVDELKKIASVTAAPAAQEPEVKEAGGGKMPPALLEHLKSVGKKGVDAAKKHPAAAAAAAGVTAGGAAGYAAGKKKESSAFNELAAEAAVKMAADAEAQGVEGISVEEVAEKVASVLTLGFDDSNTKIASAETTEQALAIRGLELLELAGYKVNW